MPPDNRAVSTRRLGREGLAVCAIGLGDISLSNGYGPADNTASIAILHRAIELGVTHPDSADNYRGGHNEILIGRAIADRRDGERVAIASAGASRCLGGAVR